MKQDSTTASVLVHQQTTRSKENRNCRSPFLDPTNGLHGKKKLTQNMPSENKGKSCSC